MKSLTNSKSVSKKLESPRVFFGWWILLAVGIISMMFSGFQGYGFSALFIPIASELNFNRAIVSAAASIARFEGGLLAPFTGWVTDRFGPKWVVISGIVLLGGGFLLMYYTHALWAFYVVWGGIVGTGFNIAYTIPMEKTISNWFVRKRGLAQSIRSVSQGLGGVVVLPLVAWLIATQGWRMTCVIAGLIILVTGLPLAGFFIRQRRPEFYGLLPDGANDKENTTHLSTIEKGVEYADRVQELEFSLKQSVRTPAFWILITASAVPWMVMPAMTIHAIPFLIDIGFDPIRAAAMLSLMTAVSIPARLLAGYLADRVAKNRMRFLIGGAYFLQALGFAAYLLLQTVPMIYVWFLVYGIGHGAGLALGAPVRARYFGRKALGSISGTLALVAMPAGIAAPIYLGWAYDTSGSYITAFTVVAFLAAFAAVLISFALPPKPPAGVGVVGEVLR
ncbi:MFS transporter [Chloroflexota bacterium]